MRVPRKKPVKRPSNIPDIDVMQKPVNGFTANGKGEIIRVHLYGNYYLDTETGILTNQYSTGERKISATAVRDAVERAELWRKCWDACSSE